MNKFPYFYISSFQQFLSRTFGTGIHIGCRPDVTIEGKKTKVIIGLAGDNKNLDGVTNIYQLAGEALLVDLINFQRGGPCGNPIPLVQLSGRSLSAGYIQFTPDYLANFSEGIIGKDKPEFRIYSRSLPNLSLANQTLTGANIMVSSQRPSAMSLLSQAIATSFVFSK